MSELNYYLEQSIRLGVRAPEWPKGLKWFNVERPLSLSRLSGKITLLNFWAPSRISSFHALADLRALEEKYPHELAVIGVHAAKFNHERDSESIKKSLHRNEIIHPVVHDESMAFCQAYGIQSWPTFIVIGPESHVVLQTSGEGQYALLDRAIQEVIHIYGEGKKMDRRALPIKLERDDAAGEFLKFPEKVRVRGGELLISDTGHHRILIADLSGRVLEELKGPLYHPRGVEREGNLVYIADTGNHTLRIFDRQTKRFTVLAERLNSPWDIVKAGDTLFITMAGAHQVWAYELPAGPLYPFAGTGAEGMGEGPIGKALFAQPSGIAADGARTLFITDGETSAVRKINLFAREVYTLIGQGLFDFGDRDGDWDEALLQHPLGIDFYMGKVYVADSYNHKIKEIDLAKREIRTLFGGDSLLSEPAGLAVDAGRIFIADTHHHRIAVGELGTGRLFDLRLH